MGENIDHLIYMTGKEDQGFRKRRGETCNESFQDNELMKYMDLCQESSNIWWLW